MTINSMAYWSIKRTRSTLLVTTGRRVIFSAVLVLMTLVRCGSAFTADNETALKAAMFASNQYDPSVRPAAVTTISLTIVPTSLNSIDIKAQTMSISGWWVMTWTDGRLTWNANNYNGISETHVFEDTVWTPTVVVFNSVNDLTAIDADTIPLRVLSTGQVEWSPPGILTVACSTDITYFPFDRQACGISVKTFGYTLDQLLLEADADEIDMTYYSPSGEWKLLDTWTTKQNVQNFSQVTFFFRFERKPAYYGLNLVMPVVMMSVMSVFIFVLPADSGEKMGFSLTVMLTFVVLMTLLSAEMPSTADHTSFFEVYVILVLGLCALSVVLSIISLHLHFRDQHQPLPPRLRQVTIFFDRLLCRGNNKTNPHCVSPTAARITLVSDKKENVAKDGSGHPDCHTNGGAWHDEEEELTWKKTSKVMDAVLFRAYIVVVVLLTIIFLSIVGAG